MRVFLNCIAEAIAENGVKGMAGLVPGGAFAAAVASTAWKKYRDRKKDAEIRAEIQQLAQASVEEARKVAADVAREVVAKGPIEDRLNLELYLSQVPGSVRRSLQRPDDATGRTAPADFAFRTADDVLRLLPARAPRFKPGAPLVGRPDWELVKPIGFGGFAEVWLARDRSAPGRCGAVKFSHPEHVQSLRHERVLIERVMGAGGHENIVPLKDAHLDGEAPWLMYDYVEGGNLAALLKKWQTLEPPLRIAQALIALKQIAGAVAHFHRLQPPVVHRDLKPDNVLVDKVSKRVLVTDFGIGAVTASAALNPDGGGTTRFGRFPDSLRRAHTPLYASPQQRAGALPDPRDDVYALGVIAYQLLTRQLERGPGTDFGHDLRELKVGAALIELIGDCVSHKPERRPADAVEFLRRAAGAGAESRAVNPPASRAAELPASPMTDEEFDRRLLQNGLPVSGPVWDEAQRRLAVGARRAATSQPAPPALPAVSAPPRIAGAAPQASRSRSARMRQETKRWTVVGAVGAVCLLLACGGGLALIGFVRDHSSPTAPVKPNPDGARASDIDPAPPAPVPTPVGAGHRPARDPAPVPPKASPAPRVDEGVRAAAATVAALGLGAAEEAAADARATADAGATVAGVAMRAIDEAAADAKDPIKQKLFAAKAAYDAELRGFCKQAGEWFDTREAAARKDGNRKLVDQIKAERKAFDEDRELPKGAPATLHQKPAFAKKALEVAHAQAVKDYIKAKRDDEAAAVEAAWKAFAAEVNVIDLLALVDPKAHTVLGDWKMSGTALVVVAGAEPPRLQFPYEPGDEYDVEVKCKRVAGDQGFSVGLVAGGRQVLAVTDGWPMLGYMSGLDLVDKKGATDNVTTVRGALLKSDKDTTITCSVRSGRIDLSVNGKPITSFKGDVARLSVREELGVPNKKALFLCTAPKTTFQFDRITVTLVKGKGTILK